METNSEIAAFLKVKAHTVGAWRREEGWDETRRKAEKLAAERMAEAISSENINTNLTHFKVWEFVLKVLIQTLHKPDPILVKVLDRQAAIAERAQKGQRLSRGLSLDGQTEEKSRAEAQAEMRRMMDLFIETVKECVADEEARDRIGQRIIDALPQAAGVGAEEPHESRPDRAAG
jgi:hypothetical protein